MKKPYIGARVLLANKASHSACFITYIVKNEATNYETVFMTLLIGKCTRAELNKLIVLANCNFIKGRELNRLIAGSMRRRGFFTA